MIKNIKVGVCNWLQFPSNNSFYPEDIPAEWKLSYFANEFEAACITLTDDMDHGRLLEWMEDLPDTFHLSFEVADKTSLDVLAGLMQQNELPELSSLYASSRESYIMLQKKMQQFSLTGDIIQHTAVISAETIWTPVNQVKSSPIALLPDIDDKKIYRHWIELWSASSSQQELILWLDGQAARYSTLSDLRTLVELMGY